MLKSKNIKIEVRYKINVLNIAIIIIAILLLLSKFRDFAESISSPYLVQLFKLFMLGGGVLFVVLSLFKKIIFSVMDDEFLVQNAIFGIHYHCNHFKINAISDFKILYKQNSNFYWNFGGLIIPEAHEALISFKYQNKTYLYGKNLKAFDPSVIEKAVCK